ncbi:inositol monophosphatase family protein [Caenimonas soli]|uniref:inositol monophosphatase family protein n=1 Tax=Caenimonas soli TaxID=2735555 RepID=UPI0038B30820
MSVQFSPSDLDQLGSALAQAAADEIMPRFGRLQKAGIRQKSSAFDIVTEADEAAERAITSRLNSCFPEAVVVGEEAADRHPELLQALGSAELAFLVDPLDGTKNFASGLPLFGVMAAALMRGQIVGGVIHDPVGGSTAFALRDGGAWMLAQDGARSSLQVASPVPVREMEGIAGTNFLPEPLRSKVNGNLSRLSSTNWFRCAAHEYRLAASGHCHILFYNRLMPWDHAAGWLLHREAGGFSAHFDGTPYLPTHTTGGLLCAPSEASWHEARAALLT